MLSRLPITLAQLKSGNNSKKLKIKSDNYCILYMKNESNTIYQFTEKLNIKTPNNKNIGLVNLSIYYSWKNIKFHTTTINSKYLLPLGMIDLNCLMVLIQFQTFKITLNLSSKNTKF